MKALLSDVVACLQVFLTLDKAEKDKLDAQNNAMALAKAMTGPGGQITSDQRQQVMDLYRLTAMLKASSQVLNPFKNYLGTLLELW